MSRLQQAEPATFRLTLLGSPALLDASGATVPGLGPGKPLAMLAYLALVGPTRRETLVALLWDETPEDRARNAFRQTLHRLRTALGSDLLVTERDSVQLTPGGSLWCDAVEFLTITGDERLERALELYRGPFLGGLDVGSAPFEQWAEAQRQRMDAQYRSALAIASQRALSGGNLDEAVSHARKLAAVAPLDDSAALLEATALLAAGRRSEAVSSLTIFGSRMRSELGSAPSASVAEMLERLLNEGGSRTTGPAGGSLDSPAEAQFVGRESELGRLLGAWRQIGQSGSTIVVTGAQGSGKSRLISEFTQRLGSFGPALVLWGQERPASQAIPHAAIAEALRPAINAPGLAGASRHLLAEAARLLPELRDQFELPQPNPIEDDAERLRFYDGIAALLDAVSYEQPACVVIEDLHLGSPSGVNMLAYLTERLASAPVMFVLTYREPEASPLLLERFPADEVRARARDDRDSGARVASRAPRAVRIGPLSEDAVAHMITSIAGVDELPQGDLRRITELSEGVPLRVIELIRRHRNGQPLTTAPREISEILWSRLQSCSPQEQRLFLATALYWRAASLRILAAATHLSEPETLDAATALEKKGLLTQRAGGVAPAHESIASLSLENTGSAGLALLAGWAADALAADTGATHAELAHLYSLSGQKAAAHRHSRAAVHDAAASAAYDQVEALLTLGLQTASSEADRLAIESLRRAFGGGMKRLASGTRPPIPPRGTSEADGRAPASPAEETEEDAERSSMAPRFRRRSAVTAAAIGIVALAAFVLFGRDSQGRSAQGGILRDTLVVVEKGDARRHQRFYLSGSLARSPALVEGESPSSPVWIDSIALPWLNARPSPDGRFVAIERMSREGTDLYLIRADRSDTLALGTGPGDDIAAGWSPDSQWLLATRAIVRDGTYDTDLVAYSAANPALVTALDTTASRAVVDAAWSPVGTMICWVARTGSTRQQDVFVSDARGRGVRNLSDHIAEDYHPAWSPNGESITFTTDRHGNAELYSIGVATGTLRRLTIDDAHDDRAAYSPNGDFVAFESTRAGDVGVYVMKPAGGNPRRLTPADRNFELAGWRGRAPSFVDRVRIIAPEALAPGSSGIVHAQLSDQFGSLMPGGEATWGASGPATILPGAAAPGVGTRPLQAIVRTSSPGLARVVASVSGWRDDTAYVRVGDVLAMVSEEFDTRIASDRWIPLGVPASIIAPAGGRNGSPGLILNGDNQWESGLLSRGVFPLRPGLSVSAWISAPFATTAMPASAGIWLVATEAEGDLDRNAPQFLKIAGIAWLAEAGRIAYSTEREFATELVSGLPLERAHSFRMTVDRDNRVSFYIDGRLRRRSTVLVTRPGEAGRAQLWVAGRGTGSAVVVDDLRVSVGGAQ